jgi:hypothetical protein
MLLGAGCSSDDRSELPAGCRSGVAAIQTALRTAPAPVRLGGSPLSVCVARSSDPGDMQRVGADLIAVASGLADEARARPESRSLLRLGYLVGAVRRGAVRTPGTHEELRRRVEQELIGVRTSAVAFVRGERAGRTSG